MRAWWKIYQHQEKAYPLAWYNNDGELWNFSAGYSFSLSLVSDGLSYLVKTSGFLPSVPVEGEPNLVVGFSAGELLLIPPGIYQALIVAHHTVNNTDDVFNEFDPPIIEVALSPIPA